MNLLKYGASSLMVLIFLSGCRVTSTKVEDRTTSKNLSAAARPFTITLKGLQRRYFVHIPLSYNHTKKWPVVVMFHGGGGTARVTMWETGWSEKADQEGFLAVFPEGTPPDASRPPHFRENPQTWNDGSKRPNVYASIRGVPDTEFISAMIANLIRDFSVDDRRIYASGFSNGASMTFRVARELDHIIAAAAPVAGSDWLSDTNPERSVPLLYITGAADPLNPIEGGKIRMGRKVFGNKPATKEMIGKWVKMHGCTDNGRIMYDEDGATGVAYCFQGDVPQVALYTIEKHGHHWPGGKSALPRLLAGRNTAKLYATDVIWEFFKAHPLSE
ncbi:MAG: hypothetical protein GY699_24310 [Desulfobacteraceae bacterium]|nr:hypothetical protein [Desulfobacteraceae bacterium]